MRWEVTGADRSTGDEMVKLIEADNEDSARRRGNRAGLMVAEVRPLDSNDSAAGMAALSYATPGTVATSPPPAGPSHLYVQTVQQTSKVWKLQMLLGALAAIAGVILTAIAWQPPQSPTKVLYGVGMLFGGLLWYAFARVMAWWFHG